MKETTKALVLIGIGIFLFAGAIARLGEAPVAILFLFLGFVLTLIVYHRGWAAIQDGHASVTPGEAVGYSFIPLFNFYWLFPLIRGFAADYNALIVRRKLDAPPLNVGLFTATAVCWLLAAPAFLGPIWRLAPLALAVLQLMVASRVLEAIGRLPKIEPEPVVVQTPPPE